ncbi:hypothetical protein FNO01nite_10520 [Flavobacterium noncentrifugens]|uniref:Glycosyl transferase family 2 n=1 Tax=Flavobacterium noncentrifugens TaxID=1128970 RepID=A0A1G8V8G0_9FLAO|nr:glycosyltransferase [Flavobacterium noncentrifugens]GEP50380.1 hypothetical protein FNO01nite_10520 [Flavobacterium noncentrifugens]SDJ62137.1 Glycosyl transferase family 2 [Flavobacterium noncentrifugens]
MKKLSVIIPVYNVERYIEKCIGSVLNNDLAENDFEIIVVNDETPDNSLAIVESIAAKHANIIVISQQNKGLGGARNTGIKNATGEYILFLDADDWINPGMLSKTLSEARNAQVDMLEFGAEGITPDGKITYHNSLSSEGKSCNGFDYTQHYNYMWSACNKLYRTQFLKDNALYFMEHIYFEDLEFFTRLIPKASKIQAIPEIVASFYQSGDSITRNTSTAKKQKAYRDIVTIAQNLHDHYIKIDHSKKNEQGFYLQYLGILVVTLFFQFFKNSESFELAKAYRKELQDKDLYYIGHKIIPSHKDWFRRIFLKNFMLFRILLLVKPKKKIAD